MAKIRRQNRTYAKINSGKSQSRHYQYNVVLVCDMGLHCVFEIWHIDRFAMNRFAVAETNFKGHSR